MDVERGGQGLVIVLSHPEWWLDHVDELVDALTVAARDPERDEPVQATDDEVVIADPGWWLEHIDELEAGLAEAVREREPPQREGSIDLDAWLSRARDDPEPEPEHDRDHGIER